MIKIRSHNVAQTIKVTIFLISFYNCLLTASFLLPSLPPPTSFSFLLPSLLSLMDLFGHSTIHLLSKHLLSTLLNHD